LELIGQRYSQRDVVFSEVTKEQSSVTDSKGPKLLGLNDRY
jgi:hypothetical protein